MSDRFGEDSSERTYIRHGFLHDIFVVWIDIEGTEWGDAFSALLVAYHHTDVFNGEELRDMERILARGIVDAWNDGWLLEQYPDEVLAAQRDYPRIAAYWRDRQKGFPSVPEGFVQTIEQEIPVWMMQFDEAEARGLERDHLQEQRDRLAIDMARIDEKLAALQDPPIP